MPVVTSRVRTQRVDAVAPNCVGDLYQPRRDEPLEGSKHLSLAGSRVVEQIPHRPARTEQGKDAPVI